MELRKYQLEAVDAIDKEWYEEGHRKTLLVLPTGCGKTICFAEVIRRQNKRGKKSLVLAHRWELLDQAADKIKRTTGLDSAIEMASSHAANSFLPVVVGSVQSMYRENRLHEFSRDEFGAIVIDEAHHALSDSYQRVLDYFNANVLGVTATPDRGDMKNLGEYFDSLAYEYTLPQAVRDGFLVPIKAQTIPLNIDISNVKTQQGDYSVADLGHALDPYLERIADIIAQKYADRKMVVFLPLVDTSKKFYELLKDRGVPVWEVNGNSTDRKEVLEEYENAKTGVICNSMLLTEGWDCPSVDCIVPLRPTKIRSLYCQMIGRGTRLCEGKDHLLILDFLWHTTRHELCRPTSLICKKPDVAEYIDAKMDESGEVFDINDETIREAEESIRVDREKALADMLKEQKRKKAKLVDPLQFEMSLLDEDLRDYEPTFEWECLPPTDKQLKAIEKFGINADSIESKGYACMLMDRLIKRANMGYSTPKQIRCLEQRGFLHVGDWTFEEASRMIGRLASNNWGMPFGLIPEQYVPASLKKPTLEWE